MTIRQKIQILDMACHHWTNTPQVKSLAEMYNSFISAVEKGHWNETPDLSDVLKIYNTESSDYCKPTEGACKYSHGETYVAGYDVYKEGPGYIPTVIYNSEGKKPF